MILIISLIVLFLHSTTWDEMIFSKIKKIIPPEGKIYKAVYGCPICMTPYYGTLLYWVIYHNNVKEWLVTIGASAGLAVVYVVLLTLRDACLTYKKNNE